MGKPLSLSTIMTYEQAMSHSKEMNSTLRADDERFRKHAKVVCKDGSLFFVSDSFLVRDSVWIFMYSEHYAPRVFHVDDVIQHLDFIPNRDY